MPVLRPHLEKIHHKERASGVAQVAECPPSKHEALNSNPAPPKQIIMIKMEIIAIMIKKISESI
jgi:hypothetical protein